MAWRQNVRVSCACFLLFPLHTCCNLSKTSGSSHKWRFVFWVNVSWSQFLFPPWVILTGILRVWGFFLVSVVFCLLFFLPSSAASSTAGWEPLGTPFCSSSWFLGLCWCQHVIAKCYGCNVSSDVQCQIGPLCKDVQRTREF